eukprot:gnl/Dysnectes_brevis/2222_a2594_1569.p1 GENE.gnl/Dysnectes_brevis/2222_a2594_1569~~gnl/Dysnectes_brevis/2222_a2594_1569.p1  ORF type:complete len:188 (-),score=17.94 gnl/Dysnectes_brevis/2222_a2594_1569:40-603(-)
MSRTKKRKPGRINKMYKAALDSPLRFKWPKLSESQEQNVIVLIDTFIKTHRSSDTGKRGIPAPLKDSVILGFNQCMRAIEQNTLKMLICFKTHSDPLIDVFLPPCRVSNVPVLPMSLESTTVLAKRLHLKEKQLTVIGIKQHELTDSFLQSLPSLHVEGGDQLVGSIKDAASVGVVRHMQKPMETTK